MADSEATGFIQTEDAGHSKRDLSPDDILNYLGFGPFQVLAFLLSGFTYFSYGSDVSIFVFIGDSVKREWNVTDTEYAILPASTAIPNVVGALFFSYISDRFGRWWPYATCLVWMGAFSIASAFSNRFIVLIILRCFTSFGIGGIPGQAFPTVIEFLPIRNRGSVGVMNMLVAVLGMCLSCGLAWWFIPAYPQKGWRLYVASVAVPTLIVAVFRLVFCVESPRYLIANGKYKKAWKVFGIMAKLNGKRLTDFVSYDTFKSALISKEEKHSIKKHPSIFLNVLKIFHPRYLRRTIPLSLIMVTQSMGYLISQLYLPDFLEKIGIGTYSTLMVTFVAQIPGVLLLSIIIEWPRVGRLNSLRLFSFIAAIFFLLLALVQTSLTIPLFLIVIYFCTGPIMGLIYTYISEAYPTSIRSITTSYFYILQALTYLVGALASSKTVDVSQRWVFPAMFSGVYFVQLIVSFVLNYEPTGKKLKDIM